MDTNDQPAATPAGQQTLALPGVGPVPGALYKNRRVNVYLVVVAVVTRRKTWVIVRKNGVEDELPLADLETYWQPV